MSPLSLFKLLVVLSVAYLLFRRAILRRWPRFELKLRISLFASAGVLVLYKIVLTVIAYYK